MNVHGNQIKIFAGNGCPNLAKEIADCLNMSLGKIEIGMPMEKVMKIFDETNAWNLPVVDEQGKYVGFVSKSKIFNSYRRVLVHFSQD